MHHSKQCRDLVAAWEGLPDGDPATVNLDPYIDPVGIWTIGYGRALRGSDGKFLRGAADRKKAAAQFPGGITRARAGTMLDEDLTAIEAAVTALAGSGTTQPQFDALLSFEFNVGLLTSSTLRKLHRKGAGAGGALDGDAVKALAKRVRERTLGTLKTIAEAFGATAECTYARLYPATINSHAEARFAGDVAAGEANAFGEMVRTLIAKS